MDARFWITTVCPSFCIRCSEHADRTSSGRHANIESPEGRSTSHVNPSGVLREGQTLRIAHSIIGGRTIELPPPAPTEGCAGLNYGMTDVMDFCPRTNNCIMLLSSESAVHGRLVTRLVMHSLFVKPVMHKIRLCRTPLRYAIELSPRLWSDPREQSEWGRNFEHGSPVCCCTLYVVVLRRSGPPNLFRGWSTYPKECISLCTAPRVPCRAQRRANW
jgi:hypothetical protein